MTSSRPFTAPARSRTRLRPADGALHLLGDTHFESPPMTATRKGVWANDLDRAGILPDTLHTLVMGDLVDNGVPGNTQDPIAVSFMNNHFGAGNWHSAVGNHDIFGSRTPDDAAASWGMPAANYVVDLPNFPYRLIFLAPDGLKADQTAMTDFTPTRLNWLNAQLTKPSIIICHWTLYGTVGALEPDTSHGVRSIDGSVSATVDADVRQVLADNPNAKAWLSGHTHSTIEIQGLVTNIQVGGHTLAAINCSAIAYTGTTVNNLTSPLISLFATVTDGRIDVRFRNHGAGIWGVAGPDRKGIWSATLAP